MISVPLAPAADDAMQDRDQVLGQGREIAREGRRDSNMKTQQPPQIAGLLHRVVVQGDDFVLSSLPKLPAGLAVVDGLVDVGVVSW